MELTGRRHNLSGKYMYMTGKVYNHGIFNSKCFVSRMVAIKQRKTGMFVLANSKKENHHTKRQTHQEEEKKPPQAGWAA